MSRIQAMLRDYIRAPEKGLIVSLFFKRFDWLLSERGIQCRYVIATGELASNIATWFRGPGIISYWELTVHSKHLFLSICHDQSNDRKLLFEG